MPLTSASLRLEFNYEVLTHLSRKNETGSGPNEIAKPDQARLRNPGQTVAQPEHIDEMWKLSLGHQIPRSKEQQMTFRQEVEQADLSRYEEVSR